MNLMNWMHRKLRNDNSSFKTSSAGNSCSCFPLKPSLSNEDTFAKPSNSSKPMRRTRQDSRQPIDEFKSHRSGENFEEADSEVFPGFLTIGTLSLRALIPEPVTPTFALPSEETTQRNPEDVKLDLELVSNKVEMILKNDPDKLSIEESKEGMQLSKEEKKQDDAFVKLETFPEQGYLLGFPSMPTKKEEVQLLNTSFHDMLKVADGDPKTNSQDRQQHGKRYKSPTNLMRKMLQAVQPTKASATAAATNSTTPRRKKFHKIQQLIRKKVHPNPNEANEFSKKHQIMMTPNSFPGEYPRHRSESEGKFNCRTTEMEEDYYRTDLKLALDMVPKIHLGFPPKGISSSSTSEEHWINTDADYLVLELRKNERDDD